MIQPKCAICDKELDGYQTITADFIAEKLKGDNPDEKLWAKTAREQVTYQAHDPLNPKNDIWVYAHKDCFDLAKKTFRTFDKPTEVDILNPVYPKLVDGIVADGIIKEIIK